MADVLQEVKIVFNAIVGNAAKGINDLSRSFNKFDAAVQGVAGPLAKVGDSVLKFDAVVGGLAIGGLAYAAAKALEFDGAIVNLTKVMGDADGTTQEAEKNALALSNQYGQSAASILESTAGFKKSGYDIQDAMLLTKNSMDLVIAGEISATEATEILKRALKGFDVPATDAAKVMDILNAVSNNTGASLDQLATGFSRISPVAKLAGFSMEETAGTLTPMIEVFGSGAEAANALKSGLLSLSSNTANVTDALKNLGVSQKDTSGAMKSGGQILKEVQEAMKDLTKEEQLYYTQQLVGKEQAAQMVVAFTRLEAAAEATGYAMDSAGSAAREVKIALEAPQAQIDRLIVGFDNLALSVGTKFKDALGGAAGGFAELENALQGAVEGGSFDPFLDAISDFGNDAEKLFKGVAKALPEALKKLDFTEILASLDKLGGAFSEIIESVFGEGFDPTKAEDLAGAIQKVIDGFTGLANVTRGMVEAFKPFVSAIDELLTRSDELGEQSQVDAGKLLGSAQIIVNAGTVIGGAIVAIGQSGKDMGDSFDIIIGSITGIWNAFRTGVEIIALVIVEWVQFVLGNWIALSKLAPFDPFLEELQEAQKYLEFLAEDIEEKILKSSQKAAAGASQAFAGIKGDIKAADEAAKKIDLTPKYDGAWRQEMEGDFDSFWYILESTSAKAKEELAAIPDEEIFITTVYRDDGTIDRVGTVLKKFKEQEVKIPIKIEEDPDALEKFKATLESNYKNTQAFFDYKVSIDTNELKRFEAEANVLAESMKSLFDSVGDSLDSLISAFSGDVSYQQSTQLRQWVEEQLAIQREALELTRDYNNAMIKYLEARTKDINSGRPDITIDAGEMEPELVNFVLKAMQLTSMKASQLTKEWLTGFPKLP